MLVNELVEELIGDVLMDAELGAGVGVELDGETIELDIELLGEAIHIVSDIELLSDVGLDVIDKSVDLEILHELGKCLEHRVLLHLVDGAPKLNPDTLDWNPILNQGPGLVA